VGVGVKKKKKTTEKLEPLRGAGRGRQFFARRQNGEDRREVSDDKDSHGHLPPADRKGGGNGGGKKSECVGEKKRLGVRGKPPLTIPDSGRSCA